MRADQLQRAFASALDGVEDFTATDLLRSLDRRSRRRRARGVALGIGGLCTIVAGGLLFVDRDTGEITTAATGSTSKPDVAVNTSGTSVPSIPPAPVYVMATELGTQIEIPSVLPGYQGPADRTDPPMAPTDYPQTDLIMFTMPGTVAPGGYLSVRLVEDGELNRAIALAGSDPSSAAARLGRTTRELSIQPVGERLVIRIAEAGDVPGEGLGLPDRTFSEYVFGTSDGRGVVSLVTDTVPEPAVLDLIAQIAG